MREILYFQAGSYSNHIGTHFWNTQDAYHTAKPDLECPIDDHVSFTERHHLDGSVLYPRVIMFDWKENFGTLAQTNALMGADEPSISESSTVLWDRKIDEIQQDRIPKSPYHVQLEETITDGSNIPMFGKIRYWSDYSHVYYLPRSVQQVSRPSGGAASVDDWKQSQDQFRQYDETNDLMDTSIRLFLEDCDSIQCVQLMSDVSSFGGFSDALLTQLEDEFLKTPAVAFPILSTGGTHAIDVDDARSTRRVINEALYLRSLQERTTISIPISAPQSWSEKAWIGSPTPKSPYFSSSIIAAHVENVTFSLRTGTPQDSINAYAAQLVAGGGTHPFAQISGVIPVDSSTNFGHCLANFTNPVIEQYKECVYSVRDVIRGFSSLERRNYEGWKSGTIGHLRPETSYFVGYPLTEPLHTTIASDAQALGKAHMLSRLSTSNGLAHLFKGYASLIDASLRRRTAGLLSMDIDADDMRELTNDLWNIHDSYPVESHGLEPGDLVGSDEE